MKLRSIILLGLLFPASLLNAQTDFRPGYIINKSGDTLSGQIDYRGDLFMSSLCRFKEADNTIKEYSPNDIEAYRFIDSKYYVSKEINKTIFFLEYLIKGKINIYYLRDETGDHYYLDKEDVKLTEIPYEEGIKYVDDKQVYFETTKHIGLLNYYMQDAPEFQTRIQTIKKPGHQNLIKLAEEYHNAVCKGEKCVIYEKSVPPVRIIPEMIGGVIKYSTIEHLNDKFYTHTGIIGHIWMPRTSEKLYFRTGVLFSQLNIDNEKSNFFKIPCQLEFIYPKGIFRPRIAYGLNFYLPGFQSVSFNIGTNIKLTEKLFLSATSEIEFNPMVLIIPKDLLSYSLQLGLFWRIK